MELELETSIKAEIEEAEKLIAMIGGEKLQLTDSLGQMMFDHRCWLSRLVDLNCRKEELVHSVIRERRKMDLLQQLPHKLRFADNTYQKKPIKLCLSAQEMSKHNLHFRMEHGSKSLVKEKRLLKEMKLSQKEAEDGFASFWTQWEDDFTNASENIIRYRRYGNGIVCINLHTLKQTWWLQHQMPFLISKGDIKDREGDIRELEWRIETCGVGLPLLQKKADKTLLAFNRSADTNPIPVKGKTWTCLVTKKKLQDQIKLASKNKEESRKTQLALGLGLKLSEVQRELVTIERDMESLKKKMTLIDQKKDEAHQYIFKLRKQQA
ncbi:hypothetical protein ACLB2K_018990 [Fragaria x ananassa]